MAGLRDKSALYALPLGTLTPLELDVMAKIMTPDVERLNNGRVTKKFSAQRFITEARDVHACPTLAVAFDRVRGR